MKEEKVKNEANRLENRATHFSTTDDSSDRILDAGLPKGVTRESEVPAIVVSIEQLEDKAFVAATERCFLRSFASYVTDGVVGEEARIHKPLEDRDRENMAIEIGEFFVQHCHCYLERCEAIGLANDPLPDELAIRETARFICHKFGNRFENDEPKGAFAIELTRAKQKPKECFFIVSPDLCDKELICGVLTAEFYQLKNYNEGIYLREFMIDPRFRAGFAIRTILDTILDMSRDVSQISIATRTRNAEGAVSKTLKLYQAFGFQLVENHSTDTELHDGLIVLAQNLPVLSQKLDARVYGFLKGDVNSMERGLKRFSAFF